MKKPPRTSRTVGRLHHVATVTIAPDARAVRDARRFVRRICEEWHVEDMVADNVVVIVSELVTNAVTHARSDVVVRLHDRDGAVRVEIDDEDTRMPVRMRHDWASLGGRGLAVVDALADDWGAISHDLGKSIWADVRTGAADDRAHQLAQ